MNQTLPPAAQTPVQAIAPQDVVDFPELWRTLNRYKWGVLGIGLLAAVGGLLYALSQTPLYRATVSVHIEHRLQRTVDFQEVHDPGLDRPAYFGTQTEMLQSRALASRVVDRLNLIDHPEFNVAPREPLWARLLPTAENGEIRLPLLGDANWRSWLPFLPEESTEAVDEYDHELHRRRVVGQVASRISVGATPYSQILRVSFVATSPQLAADAANTLADVFIESGLEARLEATQRATAWLTEKIDDLQVRLEESELRLQEFREREGLVQVGSERGLYDDEMSDAASRLREARRRRTELANTYWRVREAGGNPRGLAGIGGLLADPLVQAANENLLKAQQAVSQIQDRYGQRHPQMTEARTREQAARNTYYEQLRIAAEALRAEYEIAATTERQLAEIVEDARGELRRLDRMDYQMQVLAREADANRHLYETFLNRFNETDTVGTYEQIQARVIDPAVPPNAPFEPNKRRTVLLWFVLGLLAGITLAAIRHLLKEGIRSAEDAEHLTQLPVLGVLPLVSGAGDKKNLAVMYDDNPRQPFAEGVRSVRAALRISDVDKRFKRILITSAMPQEGKSSVASTLALALASMERVLLLDADLRAPAIARMFQTDRKAPGLMELVSGDADVEACIRQHGDTGLYLLPIAKTPPNPAEIISSAAFESLLDKLSERFDRIIIDTPPCRAAADAQVLASISDAVIFVLKADATTRRTLRRSVEQMRYANAPLLGLVINQIDVRKHRHDFGDYYYAYGYYGKR